MMIALAGIIGAALSHGISETALSALSRAQSGQGSGVANACTFLAGSGGVASAIGDQIG
jgi:hypothetical protein